MGLLDRIKRRFEKGKTDQDEEQTADFNVIDHRNGVTLRKSTESLICHLDNPLERPESDTRLTDLIIGLQPIRLENGDVYGGTVSYSHGVRGNAIRSYPRNITMDIDVARIKEDPIYAMAVLREYVSPVRMNKLNVPNAVDESFNVTTGTYIGEVTDGEGNIIRNPNTGEPVFNINGETEEAINKQRLREAGITIDSDDNRYVFTFENPKKATGCRDRVTYLSVNKYPTRLQDGKSVYGATVGYSPERKVITIPVRSFLSMGIDNDRMGRDARYAVAVMNDLVPYRRIVEQYGIPEIASEPRGVVTGQYVGEIDIRTGRVEHAVENDGEIRAKRLWYNNVETQVNARREEEANRVTQRETKPEEQISK